MYAIMWMNFENNMLIKIDPRTTYHDFIYTTIRVGRADL